MFCSPSYGTYIGVHREGFPARADSRSRERPGSPKIKVDLGRTSHVLSAAMLTELSKDKVQDFGLASARGRLSVRGR